MIGDFLYFVTPIDNVNRGLSVRIDNLDDVAGFGSSRHDSRMSSEAGDTHALKSGISFQAGSSRSRRKCPEAASVVRQHCQTQGDHPPRP